MYDMVYFRLDNTQVVSMVSLYMSRPEKGHWDGLKWLLRCLTGTSHVCLEFGENTNGVICHCDSDYGGDLDDRKSTSGCVFTLGGTTMS